MVLASSWLMFFRSKEAICCILYTVAEIALACKLVALHRSRVLIKARADEHPRISSERAAREIRRSGPGRLSGDERRGGCGGSEEAAWAALGGEGPDPRRGPRQGQVQGARRQSQGRSPATPFIRPRA